MPATIKVMHDPKALTVGELTEICLATDTIYILVGDEAKAISWCMRESLPGHNCVILADFDQMKAMLEKGQLTISRF